MKAEEIAKNEEGKRCHGLQYQKKKRKTVAA